MRPYLLFLLLMDGDGWMYSLMVIVEVICNMMCLRRCVRCFCLLSWQMMQGWFLCSRYRRRLQLEGYAHDACFRIDCVLRFDDHAHDDVCFRWYSAVFVDDVGQFFGEEALPLRYRHSLSLLESREGSYSVHITIDSLLMVKHVLVM